jgi:hypothetical protein
MRVVPIFILLILTALPGCGVQTAGDQSQKPCYSQDCTHLEFDEDEHGDITVATPNTGNNNQDGADNGGADGEDSSGTVVPGEPTTGTGDEGEGDPGHTPEPPPPGDDGPLLPDNPPNPNQDQQNPDDSLLGKIGEGIAGGLNKLGKGLQDMGSVLSGEARRREAEARRKRRDMQRKVNEAQRLADRVVEYEKAIGDVATNLDQKNKRLSSAEYPDEQDFQERINQSGRRHNEMVTDITSELPDISTEPPGESPDAGTPPPSDEDAPQDCQLKLSSCEDPSPEDKKIINTRNYIDYARKRVADYEGKKKQGAETLLEAADVATDEAESSYAGGEVDEGDALVEMGLGLADAAIGFTPGVGWAHDVYQAVTGTNLITGEELDTFDRSMAVLGVMSGGILSKVGTAVKASKTLRRLADSGSLVKGSDKYTDAVRNAEKYKDAGLDKKTLDDLAPSLGNCFTAVDPISVPRRVLDELLGLFEETAYAAANENCGEILDEILEAANKPAKEIEASVSTMPTNERVGFVKSVARVKAKSNRWKFNSRLKTKNGGRDIYTDKKGTHWGVDTQHGRWEKFNRKTGIHEGEFNFDGIQVKPAIRSRRINL